MIPDLSAAKPALSGAGEKLSAGKTKVDSSTDLKAKEVFAKKDEPFGGYDSDDDIPPMKSSATIIGKNLLPEAGAMTIPCKDKDGNRKNIKGSTLIEIVHDKIQQFYGEVIELGSEYEKERDGAIIPAPLLENGTIVIREAREWLVSLGGWKGMAPKEEVRKYFFSYNESEKFTGARIFDNLLTFPIEDHRIHIPKGFSIGKFDVTLKWEETDGQWNQIVKTDLSYPQIFKALNHVKTFFGLQDKDIAVIQLSAVGRCIELPKGIWGKTPKENQVEIESFLDYVNALMFGIEPSGLNAAFVISLMTLDLIADGELTYKTAFKANKDGGVYPYACFRDNKGSYENREKILRHAKENQSSLSMKEFRKSPALSLVATKEAIMIKTWLVHRRVIDPKLAYDKQINQIKTAVGDLYSHYLCNGIGVQFLKKFAVMGISDGKKADDKKSEL